MKFIHHRGREAVTIAFGRWGFTAWRRGAISFLAPFGDGVPLQLVFGDWWEAHPETPRTGEFA